jgi:prepilin-type processing-associated H-X9-DG protein
MANRYAFAENSSLKITDILDGTSNTLMLAETTRTVYVSYGLPTPWGYRAWIMFGLDPARSPGRPINEWVAGDIDIVPASDVRPGQLASWGAIGSYHTAGANFALLDGSVRFVNENIDTTTLVQAARFADGNSPGLD